MNEVVCVCAMSPSSNTVTIRVGESHMLPSNNTVTIRVATSSPSAWVSHTSPSNNNVTIRMGESHMSPSSNIVTIRVGESHMLPSNNTVTIRVETVPVWVVPVTAAVVGLLLLILLVVTVHCLVKKYSILCDIIMMELALEETMASLKSKLEASQRTVEEQRSQLKELKDRHAEQAAALKEMRKEREDGKVSFSASLLESGAGSTGPFDEKTTLKYQHVITNIGGAYDPDTGVFTAPVRGVYHFTLFALGPGHDSTGTGVCLHRNEQQVVTAWSRQPQERVFASNGASLLLEKDDEVCVKLWPNSWVYDNDNRLTTFSGHLLFLM
ncbi:hypothetical protein ACEWY4_020837 [Coilia grayii]|uniref:C1q domain-containing protein n=1 Tax=Coilia grayii TaxID=363190 RepID=A0ABD1J8D3_9TELE